jgi:hypothetical protein
MQQALVKQANGLGVGLELLLKDPCGQSLGHIPFEYGYPPCRIRPKIKRN